METRALTDSPRPCGPGSSTTSLHSPAATWSRSPGRTVLQEHHDQDDPRAGSLPLTAAAYINEQPLTPRNRWILSRVGAMIEALSFYGTRHQVEQNLRLFADLYGVPRTRVGEVLELVDMADAARKKVDRYSLGMKQRLGIARAFLNRPDLVILDEPTNGLDPFGVREIRQLIGRLAGDEGVTFLVARTSSANSEQICNRAVILDRGRVVVQKATFPSLMAAHGSHDLEHLFLSVLNGARDADAARA